MSILLFIATIMQKAKKENIEEKNQKEKKNKSLIFTFK